MNNKIKALITVLAILVVTIGYAWYDTSTKLVASANLVAEQSNKIVSITAERDSLDKLYTQAQKDVAKLMSDNTALSIDKANLISNNTAMNASLSYLHRLFPLRDFTSTMELINWVARHPFVDGNTAGESYGYALDLQQQAANEGYLIAPVIFLSPRSGSTPETATFNIYCTAIAGRRIYYWFPGEPPSVFPVASYKSEVFPAPYGGTP